MQMLQLVVYSEIIYFQGWVRVPNTGDYYMSGALIGSNDDYFSLEFQNNKLIYSINQAIFGGGEYTLYTM